MSLLEFVACARSAPLPSWVEAACDSSAELPEYRSGGHVTGFGPLPQSPESFLTSPFSFLTLSPEWGSCMELVLVGSPRLPSHLPPSCGFEWPLADSAHRHGVKGEALLST